MHVPPPPPALQQKKKRPTWQYIVGIPLIACCGCGVVSGAISALREATDPNYRAQMEHERERLKAQGEANRRALEASRESQRKAEEAERKKQAQASAALAKEEAKRGKKPIPSEWDGITPEANAYLKANLKDYGSLQIVDCSDVVPFGGNAWAQRVKYRAKNSFGALELENKVFAIRKGQVIAVTDFAG